MEREHRAVAEEQQHLDLLYRLIDAQRRDVADRKQAAMRVSDGTPAGLFTRDVLQYRYAEQLAALAAAEDKLCFGRLDREIAGPDPAAAPDPAAGPDPATGPEPAAGPDHTALPRTLHIGRIGIADDGPQREQVLVDWRAPAAAPFYTATALNPQGVTRRRHIRTNRRAVLSVADEYLRRPDETGGPTGKLDPQAGGSGLVDESTIDRSIGGDGALLDALNAPRTGRMGDIIETIQAEQDAIIRSAREGVLVVQGGPGTGKTVVALHRAAYLLYTYRARLGSHGVLVVGPSRTFLDYIGAVLPSLGETSVVLTTIGTLVPGVAASAVDEPAASALKGSLRMAKILDNAVMNLQRMPRAAITIGYDHGTVTMTPDLLRRAQERAWASRRPHNRARAVFIKAVLRGLANQVAGRPGVASLDPDAVSPNLDEIMTDLAADLTVQAALTGLWPLITPEQLVRQLFADPERLTFAAPSMSQADRALLTRPIDAPLTESDIPLIDEAAELLGDISLVDSAAAAALAEELAYARDTLEALGAEQAGVSDSGIEFTLAMLAPEDIARLHDTAGPVGTTADRAGADRTWTYGHVVVDEAQELSPMAWRSLFRRCPLGSMTVVGDTAQAADTESRAGGSAGAGRSWAAALDPHAKGRWRLAELTVNYRTPAEIMALAEPVLAAIDRRQQVPTSMRETGYKPYSVMVPSPDGLASAVADAVAAEAEGMTAGQLAVLHHRPADRAGELLAAVRARVPDAADIAGPGRSVVVLDVRESKGLEFDRVILAEPAEFVSLGDLYVAITRATQRLGIVHAGPLPAQIDQALLAPRD